MAVSKHMDAACLMILTVFMMTFPVFAHSQPLPVNSVSPESDFYQDLYQDFYQAAATRVILNGDQAEIRGGGVRLNGNQIEILQGGAYQITGDFTDGGIYIRAGKHDKVYILLDGASIHRERGAALYIERAERVICELSGENFLSCGADFEPDFINARIDGAVYSRCDLTLTGAGNLFISAPYRHGIVCNDHLILSGGKININAAGDGIHVHDSARFSDMDLNIQAGDDGVTVSNEGLGGTLLIKSGVIQIPSCYEGLEAGQIVISGGEIQIQSRDDGVNARGGAPSLIEITGGDLKIDNPDGEKADGLDSNGDIIIQGGHIFISVNTRSHALNYGIENGGVCEISGGEIAAFGGSLMAETFSDSSPQYAIFDLNSDSGRNNNNGAAVILMDINREPLLSAWAPYAFEAAILSVPELELNEKYILSVGGEEHEIMIQEASGVYKTPEPVYVK